MGDIYDVAIAGGGIVGAACAAECVAAGLKTVVVEPGPVGGGATAAGMGHVSVMDDSPAQIALTRYSLGLWKELAPELPPEVEYWACGALWVAAGEEEMAEVRRKKRRYDGLGVRTEVLDAQALAEAEPNLRPGLAGALFMPDDVALYTPAAARWLLRRATLLRGEAVELSGEGIRLGDGGLVPAGIVVNAAGTWAPQLTPGIEVRKRKGHLAITDRYPGFVNHQVIELAYLRNAHLVKADSVSCDIQPRRTGQVLIGSSRQYGEEDPGINPAMLARMLARAREFMPAIGALTAIRCWTGFRAATPDNLPLIGPWPRDERVYLATGHEGFGIMTAPATGRLLADMLLKRAPAIPIEPYLPGRGALTCRTR
jgi:D-hydroxyproline dehydrogenase subunit beta